MRRWIFRSLDTFFMAVVLFSCFLFTEIQAKPKDLDAFNVADGITETEEYIEAYQTTNCSEIEAYVTEVRFIDER